MLIILNNIVYNFIRSILTAVESGEISLYPTNTIEVPIINAGSNLEKMRHSRMEKNIIITGGLENKLKVFDLEKQKLIFIEKDLPHDKLQLKIPIWITDLNFLSRSQEITTVSKYGYVRSTHFFIATSQTYLLSKLYRLYIINM